IIPRCPNQNCPSQIAETLIHFTERDSMDIEGVGTEWITRLAESGLLRDVADFYKLKKEDLLKFDRMGDRSADNMISAIQSRKEVPFDRFLNGLGIRHVGEHTSRLLAAHFRSLDDLIKAGQEELNAIYEIGPKVASSIFEFFRDKKNIRLVEKLIKLGVKVLYPEKSSEKLKGLKIVVTGTLKKFSRDSIKRFIEDNAGKSIESVSKNTDYLLAGDKAGSKLDKAKKLKVKVITEDEFLKMME
ncbi:MAG: helix-hairpin-helix domain-containing protein, partial [bacterium]|nr:helix-hairpin-helix domain-containing protein [bacterium]